MYSIKDTICMIFGGMFFGYGLSYSGMISPEIVLQFLNLQNFGLILVMGGAVLITFIFYQVTPIFLKKSWLGFPFDKRVIPLDSKLLIGSAVFGIGWGLSGVCPGPAIAGLGVGNFSLIWSIIGILIGAYLHAVWASRNHRLNASEISG
jgi:uncharacterized membrane protein YedE/YeeE